MLAHKAYLSMISDGVEGKHDHSLSSRECARIRFINDDGIRRYLVFGGQVLDNRHVGKGSWVARWEETYLKPRVLTFVPPPTLETTSCRSPKSLYNSFIGFVGISNVMAASSFTTTLSSSAMDCSSWSRTVTSSNTILATQKKTHLSYVMLDIFER